jgi:glutamate/aspartate transport system substrate-binding protein
LHTIIRAAALTWAALVADVAWGGTTLDRIKQSGKIVIAHRESSVPFSYLDADQKPIGYAIDLCLKVSEALRKKLGMKTLTPTFALVTAVNRIATITEAKADLECGSTTNNAERREKVAFTVPHFITGARFLVRT